MDSSLKPSPSTVSESAFLALFTALVDSLAPSASSSFDDQIKRAGRDVGQRFLPVVVARARPHKRDYKIVSFLQFVTSSAWKIIFNHPAAALEKSTTTKNAFHVHEKLPLVSAYVSSPSNAVHCANFTSGILWGLVEAGGFSVKDVSAHSVGEGQHAKTVYLIQLNDQQE